MDFEIQVSDYCRSAENRIQRSAEGLIRNWGFEL